MTNKTKVMIVDDHQVVRAGLKQLLETDDRLEVVGEAENGLDCLKLLETTSPDLIFMDVKMPGINGIETTRVVCLKYPHIKVIMLTIYDDDHYVTEAIKVGAKGYVLKNIQREALLKVINDVINDQSFLDPTVTGPVFNKIKQKDPRGVKRLSLTHRELEVLKSIVDGYTDRMAAEQLNISEHTVRSHIKSIFKKLQVGSKAQAVAIAISDKIINKGA